MRNLAQIFFMSLVGVLLPAMAQAAEVRRRRRMAALKGALVRIERDEFGECVDCGEPIAEPRLRSDPAATLCIACASASE